MTVMQNPLRNLLPDFERRPEVKMDLSNVEEWNEYFAEHGPTPPVLWVAHWLLAKATDTYTGAPEGFREELEEHLESGNPTLILMDHTSIVDPFNAAASVYGHSFLRWIIGNNIIPARPSEFKNPLAGWFLTHAGAKPVVREKDLEKYYTRQGLSEDEVEERLAEVREDRVASNAGPQQVAVLKVNDGKVYATFPGGERKHEDEDPAVIKKPFKDGPRNLLEGIENADKAKIIYITFDYGGGRFMKRFFTPTIHMEIRDAPAPDEDFNVHAEAAMQESLDAAIANRRGGAPLSPIAKVAAIVGAVGVAAAANKFMKRR